MKKLFYLSILISLFCAGCIKKGDLNFKNVKIDNWQPDWALPILNSTLTLKNVVRPNTTITEDATGLYSLHYGSTLYSLRASDYIMIQDQNLNTPTIPLSVPQTVSSFTGSISDSFSSNFSFSDTSGAQLAHIAVKFGSIYLNVSSTFRQNVTAVIIFPNIIKNGTPLQVSTVITYPATTATFGTGLDGYTIDMTNGGTTKNYLAYKLRFTLTGTGQPITGTDNISANVRMTGVKYSFIDGFIGHFNIPIPLDTINVAVFNNTLTANIFLRNPKINLSFKNSMGISAFADFDNIYGITNVGTPVNMSVSGIPVNGPTTPGQTAITNTTIDSSNSTIQNLFNPAPNHVIYTGRIVVNPTIGTAYNFVTDSSYVSLYADAELPAWFKIIDFSLQDTLPLSLPLDTSLLQTAEFKLLMDNAFPVYGTVQLYFVDAGYHILDSLVTTNDNIVGEAPVDADGKVNGHTSKVTHFFMEHNRYNAMVPKVKYAFIRGSLKTSGTNTIKIFASDNLVVKLAFRFTLNVSTTTL